MTEVSPAREQLSYSQSIRNLLWNVVLGVVKVRGVDLVSLQPALASLAESIVSVSPDNHKEALLRMGVFESYFAASKCRSPLGPQFEALQRKETPRASGLIQSLLLLEMSTGLLMGAQNATAIKGELLYDVATEEETFRGMRNQVRCLEGELVLKDAEGIIAGLLQGPDHRTRLEKKQQMCFSLCFLFPVLA